jgi:hypothetical protein
MRFIQKISVILLAVFLLVSVVSADVKITSTSKTSAFMGKPAKEEETITYLSEAGMYIKRGEKVGILYNAQQKNITFLLKENEQYMEVDWKKMEALTATMADFMKGTKWEVKNTGKKEKIGEYDTTVWTSNMKNQFTTAEMTFYQTDQIKLPSIYRQAMEDMLKLQANIPAEMTKEFMKMTGYAVKSTVKVKIPQGELEVITDVKKVEYKDLKKTLFEIPKEFRKIDFDVQKLQQLQ